MRGIAKIINELGLLMLAKEMKIEEQQKEIDELRELVELVENHLNA